MMIFSKHFRRVNEKTLEELKLRNIISKQHKKNWASFEFLRSRNAQNGDEKHSVSNSYESKQQLCISNFSLVQQNSKIKIQRSSYKV